MAYKVGVTGHRKLLMKEEIVRIVIKDKLREILQTHKEEGIEVNTGMALGFDQTVCDACLDLGVPYVAVVPCDGQDSLWSPPQRQRYEVLLSKAARVVNVNPGPYEPWKMHARNGWIVGNSQEMVVHWDGFYQGGTGSCMKLVKAEKLPFFNTFTPGSK